MLSVSLRSQRNHRAPPVQAAAARQRDVQGRAGRCASRRRAPPGPAVALGAGGPQRWPSRVPAACRPGGVAAGEGADVDRLGQVAARAVHRLVACWPARRLIRGQAGVRGGQTAAAPSGAAQSSVEVTVGPAAARRTADQQDAACAPASASAPATVAPSALPGLRTSGDSRPSRGAARQPSLWSVSVSTIGQIVVFRPVAHRRIRRTVTARVTARPGGAATRHGGWRVRTLAP